MSKKVLVIEDDPNMNEVLVETLEDEGFQVTGVFSGEEAVAQNPEVPFDLVVSDVRLAGMDGLEALAQLKARNPKLRSIVITGYASIDSPARAMQLKVDDYLMKPFGIDEFALAVHRVATAKKKKLMERFFESLFAIESRRTGMLDGLIHERGCTFKALFVGIRSSRLTKNAAREGYRKLEKVENSYRSALRNPESDHRDFFELVERYQEVMQLLVTDPEAIPLTTSEKGEVSAESFAHLYQGLQNSTIDDDELMWAPFLRTAPPHLLDGYAELLAMKEKVWPLVKA